MSFIYNMSDTWNAVGTTFAGILMNVSNGAGAVPVGAVTSQLVNVQTNGTQRFGIRMPHFVLGTDSSSFATFTDVWNTSGNPTGILYNTTNTASGSTSLLMDLQLGGTSQFKVDKAGVVTGLGTISVTTAGTGFAVKNATGAVTWGASSDTILTSPAAASLQHGAADVDTNAAMVAQTMRVQGALTGGTTNQAGKDWTFIASPGKGTGVGGKILFQASKAGGSGATPNAAATVFTLDSVSAYGLFPAGTALAAPLQLTSGTNLTTAAAGAFEYDGVQFYQTIEANNRAAVPAEQYFQLSADGGTISTIANFFGATSNITLVSGAYYEIEAILWFLKTTTNTVVFTLTNAAQPTSQNIYYEMSPVGAMIAPPGTATMLVGQAVKDTTAAYTITTGSLTDATEHYARLRIWLQNSTGVSLKIQATATTGTITPRRGSMWRCRRLSPTNVGTFVA